MMMKPWYKSKTIWFNIAALLLELIQYLLSAQIIPKGTMLIIVNLMNIVLRFFTAKILGKEEKDEWNA